MIKKSSQVRALNFDVLMSELDEHFSTIADTRNNRVVYPLSDAIKSAFAMFSLKSPSLLNFRERTRIEDGNLHRVYRIKDIPSDTQMRTILDEVPATALDYSFGEVFAHLRSRGRYTLMKSRA